MMIMMMMNTDLPRFSYLNNERYTRYKNNAAGEVVILVTVPQHAAEQLEDVEWIQAQENRMSKHWRYSNILEKTETKIMLKKKKDEHKITRTTQSRSSQGEMRNESRLTWVYSSFKIEVTCTLIEFGSYRTCLQKQNMKNKIKLGIEGGPNIAPVQQYY